VLGAPLLLRARRGAHVRRLEDSELHGSSGDAIGYVERLRAAGADEVMFLVQMGTVPQAAILETLRNLGREVLPRFRGDPAPLRAREEDPRGA
jgi:hypothetical protein